MTYEYYIVDCSWEMLNKLWKMMNFRTLLWWRLLCVCLKWDVACCRKLETQLRWLFSLHLQYWYPMQDSNKVMCLYKLVHVILPKNQSTALHTFENNKYIFKQFIFWSNNSKIICSSIPLIVRAEQSSNLPTFAFGYLLYFFSFLSCIYFTVLDLYLSVHPT